MGVRYIRADNYIVYQTIEFLKELFEYGLINYQQKENPKENINKKLLKVEIKANN